MRPTLSAALSACLLAGCAHPAYGPSSDARLEEATSDSTSSEGSDVAGLSCASLKPKQESARDADKPEVERMKLMTETFLVARERAQKLDEAVARNPDLLYSSEANAIKGNLDECRSFFADVRSDFDRFIRDVTDLPVIKEVQGNRDVARIDLAVLRDAINALDPDDKDVLVGRVDAAERRVGKPPPAKGTTPPASGRGRRR